MKRIVLLCCIPLLALLGPFALLWLWRLLERGYTAMFVLLSIGDDFAQRNMPDGLAFGSILAAAFLAIPVWFDVAQALSDHRQYKSYLEQQEAHLRWRIERDLERRYAEAMREFVAKKQALAPLPNSRAPVVVES